MPAIIGVIASFFGISTLRLAIYAGAVVAIIAAGVAIRHHYVSLGYHKAIADVKKQDDRAVEAATKVEKKTAVCTDQNGYWDVLSQRCILEDQK